MKISVFPHVKEPTNIHEYDVTFERLFFFLSKERNKVKKDNMVAWSPTIFEPKHRLAENSTLMYCLVLDIDQKDRIQKDSRFANDTKTAGYIDGTYDMIFSELRRLGICAIMHTSFSHTSQLNKFRLILPLETPIEAKKETWRPIYKAACHWLHSNFCDGLTDVSTCDTSRAYYTSPKTDDFRADFSTGIYIDFAAMGEEEKQREQAEIERRRAEIENRLAIRRSHTENIDGKRHVTFSDHRRYMYDLLKWDRDARHSLASKLGAKIVGNRAERWTCPACLRNDATYFFIEPTSATSLFCGHVNSCGDKSKPRYFSPGYIAEFYGLL